jgi:hypothetical protein
MGGSVDRRGYHPARGRIGGWACRWVGAGITPQGDVSADGRVGVGITVDSEDL